MRARFLLIALLVVAAFTPASAQVGFQVLQPPTVAGIAATTLTRQMTILGQVPIGAMDVLINISAGGTATGTLQLFIEDSVDGGVTWDDLIASLPFTFGAAPITQRFFVAADVSVPAVITTATATNITQGSIATAEVLAAGSARQSPLGDRLRVREKVSGPAGSPVGPTYSISVVMR